MMEAAPLYHVLGLEIFGRARDSQDDLGRSLAILEELVASTTAYETASVSGTVIAHSERGRLFILFSDDQTAPVRCALELSDTFNELPSMSVQMAIHSGAVDIQSFSGEGIDEVRDLLPKAEKNQALLSETYAESLDRLDATGAAFRIVPQKLFFLEPAGKESSLLRDALKTALSEDGHEIANDDAESNSIAWAQSVERRIRSADTIVAVVAGDEDENDLLQYELEIAYDERKKRGGPQILPVWLGSGPLPEGPLGTLYQNLLQAQQSNPADSARAISEVRAALSLGQSQIDSARLTSTNPAIGRDAKFYIRRACDDLFEEAIQDQESVILVKGPRQIGKTTLIGRGMQTVENLDWRYVSSDFQKLSSRQMESEEAFYRVVAVTLAQQLGVPFDFDSDWLDALGPTLNLDGLMRKMLAADPRPLVWFIDEADRLFTSDFASDFYGLLRAWHNGRALDRRGPWAKLTVVIGYATEAHLFIQDLHQSPFNVGQNVELEMFTLENVRNLNERYGRPIAQEADVETLYELLGGHPFLTRRAFDTLTRGGLDFASLMETADSDTGPFGDHLKRLLLSVTQLPPVLDALVQSLSSPVIKDSEGLHRLIAAGVLVKKSSQGYELPNDLYRRYLRSRLQG